METVPTGSPSPSPTKPASNGRNRISLSVDARWAVVFLLAVIVGMLALWQPWSATKGRNASDRTIRVTGEATVKAEPDQYVFNPSYRFTNADRAAALDALAKKNAELIAGLKQVGVKDSQIKTNANDYGSGVAYPAIEPDNGIRAGAPAYVLQLTVTVGDKALAQKTQDYLTSTAPSGSVTPYNSFSSTKRKQLESQARDEATKDARAKAEQSAGNLGFKIGDVKSVSDGSGFGVFPVTSDMKAEVAPAEGQTTGSIAVQPGENDLNYSVSVEYYVR